MGRHGWFVDAAPPQRPDSIRRSNDPGTLDRLRLGPLTQAPITDGVAAAIIAFALGVLLIAGGRRLRAGAVEVTYAVIVSVVIANGAVFLWAAAHSH